VNSSKIKYIFVGKYIPLGEITGNEANWREKIKRMDEESDHSI